MDEQKPVMQIKTPEGIANPAPLSDIQEYNKRLDNHSRILRLGIVVGSFLGLWALCLLSWIVWKVISSGAVNNYIARCVC